MIITGTRVILAVVALGVFLLVQGKQRRVSDTYLQRIKERQHQELEEALIEQEQLDQKKRDRDKFESDDKSE